MKHLYFYFDVHENIFVNVSRTVLYCTVISMNEKFIQAKTKDFSFYLLHRLINDIILK